MAEYINKDKLYQTESLLDSDIIKQDKIASYLLSQILYDIKTFPKADVAPVRRGRWIEYLKNLGECSECGEIVAIRSKYCPNCGSSMLEGETDANFD